MDCKHPNFRAQVDVSRCQRNDTEDIIVAFYADVKVWCIECGKPFEFIGIPMGLSPGQPRCSVDAKEARLPIKPVGEDMPTDLMHSYGVVFHEA